MNRSAFTLVFVVALATGCATTQVTSDGPAYRGKLAKPDRIFVYDFAATAGDATYQEDGIYSAPSYVPTAQQVETGRQLGAEVAERLVDEINDMGLTAVRGGRRVETHAGDILIQGHFESIDEGSRAGRVAIGFGSGKAELRTVVVAYLVTASGLRRVGGGSVDSAGGKGPGLFVPVLVTAATANPIGLVVGAAAKVEGEASGRTTIEGAAKRTADAIAERLKERFQEEGWIDD